MIEKTNVEQNKKKVVTEVTEIIPDFSLPLTLHTVKDLQYKLNRFVTVLLILDFQPSSIFQDEFLRWDCKSKSSFE